MLGCLNYHLGQVVTVFLAGDFFVDIVPKITKIILPNLNMASGYPINMTKIDNNTYYHKFVLLNHADFVGPYLVEIVWKDSAGIDKRDFYQVNVDIMPNKYSAKPL